ncbi:hypothetical protein CC1G_14408 [Coprinopsis cinerea okayama7|uniref:Uncharacterized protein n=1 Tax=Coprinopsis cinerea (strain Okayama-7 / 130 / ATCC MYA-4618 / FGSC 9003) TaxID=240176 RepID=D6RMA4_COPC7|nr:hypothetical protein CC1G_14408 [Coprinopsis cinerea okayama7\|eukprot:XP_002911411.1 hypothetical protein CC1G_14408 [Coprinopsis cinerea okayama7\
MVNLVRGSMIDFVPKEEAIYGFEIRNGTPWNLHFHCLYFDSMDLSITPFTEVINTGRFVKDYMINANTGIATMGYGSLGIPPAKVDFPDGVDICGGFFKFYFSTEPIDLSHVPQHSPFGDTRGMMQVKRKQTRTWGTILIPVIQRRG